MSSFFYFKTWFTIGIALIVVITYLTLTSNPPLMPRIEYGDKVSHLIAYATLMGWFGQLYTTISKQVWLCLAFAGMGITLEFLQGMGGVRMFEYADMVANALGALIGWLLSRTWFAGTLLKVDQYLASRF